MNKTEVCVMQQVKKDYKKPSMNVVELKRRASLLSSSEQNRIDIIIRD